jgi:hypothetical protein
MFRGQSAENKLRHNFSSTSYFERSNLNSMRQTDGVLRWGRIARSYPRWLVFLACMVCLTLLVSCSTRQPDRYAQSPVFGSCINGLRIIDGAKQQWALEHHADSNAVPTWDDIRPYCNASREKDLNWLRCPAGGTYTIGRTSDLPTCSIGGRGHSLE